LKHITIISPNSFGYIDFLIDALDSKPDVVVTFINFENFKFRYNSKFEKVKNGFNKLFLNKNIKTVYRSKCILESFHNIEKQNFIVVIRPDKIEKKTLLSLKDYTENLYAFYFDAISNFPKKIELIPIFDKVFSYEKDDVEKYNLKFITNYIYDIDQVSQEKIKHKIFNISSFDNRFDDLRRIATYLKEQNINYKIIARKEGSNKTGLIDITPDYMALPEVKKYIMDSEILLDIQKQNQKGLSFRVFEALGYKKKLITTNSDIVNYDFYDSNNILVLDVNHIDIPKHFLNSTYKQIPETVLYKYTLEYWIEKVFYAE